MTWNKKDRETHIKKYLATEKKINTTRENNVDNLVENTKKKVDTEQKPIRDDQARLNELDPRYTNLKQGVESLKATPTTNVNKAEKLQDARESDEEDFEEFLLLQEAEAKKKQNTKSKELQEKKAAELQDLFEENGGRRKSKKRKQRHSKSKKKKTQHIKHFKSKKNKSIKKLQKRKTRVMRNK